MSGKWTIQKAERSDQATSILLFLLEEFSRLVGADIMFREDCVVYNDPHADCPMLIINTLPVHIRLVQCNYLYWTQTIYQLSHERCHFAFRQCKENKKFTLRWFEEIVCEAMSLYALDYLRHKVVLRLEHKIYGGFGATWCARFEQREGSYTSMAGQTENYKPVFLLDGAVYWANSLLRVEVDARNMTNARYVDIGGVVQPQHWVSGKIQFNL